MWFRQIQFFPLKMNINSSATALAEKLSPLSFQPCLATMPSSAGWVSPLDEEDAPLAIGINGCIMVCLQIEEKILPASVVTQTLKVKIKQIENAEGRKVRQKEKLSFKDEIVHTLLTQAFSKLTRIYAYVDTRNQCLLINTISPKKTELFLSIFKKSINGEIDRFDVKKPSTIIHQWLKTRDYPAIFSIEKSCVLQDPNQQNRLVRCQEQDLFVSSIQEFLKEGFEPIQIALCWQDRINFIIDNDFNLRSVKLAGDDIAEIKDELETKQQKFAADFVLMSENFSGLLSDLLTVFHQDQAKQAAKLALTG